MLDKNLDRSRNIRITSTYYPTFKSHIDSAFFNRGSDVVIENKENDIKAFAHNWIPMTDSTNYSNYLKIRKFNNNYEFYDKHTYEYVQYSLFGTHQMNFEPRYVALAAFNGYRIGFGNNAPLVDSTSIPARFDWIRVEECPKQ